MLTRADKEALVENLKTDISNAKAVFLTNLIGVPSNDSVAIRKEIREAKGKVVVTRNTLFRKATEGTAYEALLKDLKGPHALAFAFEDAPAIAKCLKNAAKDFEVIEFKGGFLGEDELSVQQINELADLPTRDEMLGTLLATFNAPLSALARVLFAIQEQKEAGAPAAEAAPAAEEAAPVEEAAAPAGEAKEEDKE